MKHRVLFILVLILTASLSMAQSKLERNFEKLSQQILENIQSFYPVQSTEKGIHRYDHRFTDYSKRSIRNEIAMLKKFETRLFKYKKSNLSSESRINMKLLKSTVDIALLNLDRIKWHKNNPYVYANDAVNGIYLILVSEYSPLEIRVQSIIARLEAVPDLFKQAEQNLKYPVPVFVTMAQDMLITGIDFYRSVEAELSSRFPDLAGEINGAATRAITSVRHFQQFLEEITPGEPGSFAIGKDNFDYRLKKEYFLDYDSDSLLKIGESLFRQADSMYEAYLAQLNATPADVDSVFVVDCITKEDILAYYNWEVEQTKLFLREHGVVTIPDDIGECRVVETPPFLTNIISSIAYQPPGVYSPLQTGHFYVRPIPDSLDAGQRAARYKYIHRRGFKSSVVHEAYPGHHLQFQIASRLEDDVRKWHENMCFVEGWALYCEEMMHENGFYGSNTRQYLNILSGILFRAARIIIDVKLHTGQMNINEAVQWMAKALDADTGFVRIEVGRYALTPTVPMSYLIGKLEILKLRDAVRETEGDDFSLKDYHDKLLAEGAIPPRLLWEIWDLK